MIHQDIKDRIDHMSYTEMLSKWRFAPVGDPMFQGEIGDYFSMVMGKKKEVLADGEHSQVSKAIGWK